MRKHVLAFKSEEIILEYYLFLRSGEVSWKGQGQTFVILRQSKFGLQSNESFQQTV